MYYKIQLSNFISMKYTILTQNVQKSSEKEVKKREKERKRERKLCVNH